MPISNGQSFNDQSFMLNLFWKDNDLPGLELLDSDDPKITINQDVETALNQVVEEFFNCGVVAANLLTEGSSAMAAFPSFPVPTFPITEMFVKAGQGSKPAPKAKLFRCPMDECLAVGRGQVVHLHNLKKHFSKFHNDIYKGDPLYPCKANEARFLFDQEFATTPPLQQHPSEEYEEAWFLFDQEIKEEEVSCPPSPIFTMEYDTTPSMPPPQVLADKLLEVSSMEQEMSFILPEDLANMEEDISFTLPDDLLDITIGRMEISLLSDSFTGQCPPAASTPVTCTSPGSPPPAAPLSPTLSTSVISSPPSPAPAMGLNPLWEEDESEDESPPPSPAAPTVVCGKF